MTEGRKGDAGKAPWDLLPWGAVQTVVDVLEHGRTEYDADNWRLVKEPRRRYFAAACRHVVAWRRGEKFDPKSGLPHLAHAACDILFLLELEVGLGPTSAEMDEPQSSQVWDEEEMVKHGFELHDKNRRYVLDTQRAKLIVIARDVAVVDWAKLREELEESDVP